MTYKKNKSKNIYGTRLRGMFVSDRQREKDSTGMGDLTFKIFLLLRTKQVTIHTGYYPRVIYNLFIHLKELVLGLKSALFLQL